MEVLYSQVIEAIIYIMGISIQTGQVLLRGGDYNVQFSESGEKAGYLKCFASLQDFLDEACHSNAVGRCT